MEQRGAACGELARTTDRFDETNEARSCLTPLLQSRPMQLGRCQRHRQTESRELCRHRGPPMKQRTRRRVVWCKSRSVPKQSFEIEHARSEPEHPSLYGARHHVRGARNARQCRAVDDRGPNGIQNYVDAGHLARQRLERQHALAVPTIAATRECDREKY